MILIAGASSKPGRELMPLLAGKGYPLRALTRDPRKLESTRSLGVVVNQGDLRRTDTLLRACEGAEAVVSSVTAAGENQVREVDEAGVCSLVEAARRSGVRRFVYISAYGAAHNHPVDLFRSKFRVEEYLKASGLAYTILRPTAFMEAWCARIGAQVLGGGPLTIFGDGRNPVNFISARDVAKFILLALEDPRLQNQTLTIGGPQNLTFDEVAAVYERLSGRRVRRRFIPAWRLNLLSRLSAPFNETRSRFLAMRRDLAVSNWRVDMSRLLEQFPVRLVSLEEVARETIIG